MYISTAQVHDEDSENSSGRYITESHEPFSATLLKSLENLKTPDHQTSLNWLLKCAIIFLGPFSELQLPQQEETLDQLTSVNCHQWQ